MSRETKDLNVKTDTDKEIERLTEEAREKYFQEYGKYPEENGEAISIVK